MTENTIRPKPSEENVIDPDLLICDPHHHLWYQSENNYRIEDFLQDISGGHHVAQTVFIESKKMLRKDGPPGLQPVGETEFVSEITSRTLNGTSNFPDICAGIIGFADLTLGSQVASVLESHIAAGRGRFRGIRYTSTWDASPEIKSSSPQKILLDAKFRQGFACLRNYGLSFDAWLYHPQLNELLDLAQAYPDTSIILDHVGGPLGIGPYSQRREEIFQQWKTSIASLATCQNITVKLGGLGMSICGFGWQDRPQPPGSLELSEAFKPYFQWCIECFGPQRCMFESNFPVDKRSYSYTTLWNAFKRVSRNFSPAERQALFYDTAARVYRLPSGHNLHGL